MHRRHRPNDDPGIGQVVTYGISTDKKGRQCAVNATLAGDRVKEHKKKNIGPIFIIIAIVFFGIVGISVVNGKLPPVIFALYFAASILTYFVYALDKSAAREGAWRTPESTLHLFALVGGWPGALIAQQLLRHKSKKRSFRVVFWVTVVLNFGAFIWLFSSDGSELMSSLLRSVRWG